MRRIATCMTAAMALLSGVPSGLGQGFGPGRGRFPAVGDTLPEVTAYDANGDEFSTSSLRGQYSVLVFGCLT